MWELPKIQDTALSDSQCGEGGSLTFIYDQLYTMNAKLFHILQGVVVLLTGANLDDLCHIVDKDFAVADVSGI